MGFLGTWLPNLGTAPHARPYAIIYPDFGAGLAGTKAGTATGKDSAATVSGGAFGHRRGGSVAAKVARWNEW